MKIAVVSDIHDNIWNLEKALRRVRGCEVLICCGDLCSPFVIDILAEGFQGPTHIVFGNNDGDRYRLTLKAARHPHLHLHGEFAELALGGKSFAVHHYDDVARSLARGEVYDVVCFGHNHRYEVRRDGKTLLINPGEIMGGLSEGQVATLVVFDTESGEVERIVL